MRSSGTADALLEMGGLGTLSASGRVLLVRRLAPAVAQLPTLVRVASMKHTAQEANLKRAKLLYIHSVLLAGEYRMDIQ